MKRMKRFLSLVLAVVLVAAGLPVSSMVTAQADPPAQQSADGGYFDPTDINIPIDFSGTDQTKGSAVAKTLNYLPQKDQVVWKHPKSWEDFEALIKSTKPEDTYISLTQDIQHQWGKTLMETVSITKNKVVDLNGHTITCNLDYNVLRDYNKYTGNFSDPYPNPNEPYYYKTLMNIDEGATFYLLDSSMRNSVNGKEGTGKIQVYGWMLNPFKNDINYYPNYDIFSVSNGNLVVYGGHLMAGRSKGQMDSKFSWSKLRAVIGQTVELASNVAAYAIGIKEATSGVGDAKKAFNSAVDAFKDVKDDKEVDPKETKTENPEMTTTSPDNNKPAMKTIGGKQNDINKAKQSNSSENNGEQKTNSDGTAKSDEGSKMESNDSAIAEAILDKEKLDKIVDGTYDVVKGIAGMIGPDRESYVVQSHFGTCVSVGTNGTFVAYGGTFEGYGSTPHTRNAVIEVHKREGDCKAKAYIFGGLFKACSGANVFNIVELRNEYGNARTLEASFDENGKREEDRVITLSASETNNVVEVKHENGDPVDTSNIMVRGGEFKCYYHAKNVSAKTGNDKHFTTFMGSSGSVNLGVGSYGKDFIRDGRIQVNDMYGDGALVLMDDNRDDNNTLYHYRLLCSDLELRYKQALRVYPNTAKTNSSYSFELKTQYDGGDAVELEKILADDEENIRGAYSTTEKVSYYPIQGKNTEGYVVRPYFNNTDPDGKNLLSSTTWYYPNPTNVSGEEIEPLVMKDTYISGILKSSAAQAGMLEDPDTFTNAFNSQLNTVTTTFGNNTYVDERLVSDTSSKNLKKVFSSYDQRPQSYNYVSNMKWFEYKIYKVDPLTRLNIGRDGVLGDDEPLAVATYGSDETRALKTMISLPDLEKKIREQGNTEWPGFQQGEIYRITLSMEERLNVDYDGYFYYAQNAARDENKDDYCFSNSLGTARANCSMLLMCFGPTEKKVVEGSSTQVQDFTSLQWVNTPDNMPAPGREAEIRFVNAKTGNVDWEAQRIFDIYYQWYVVNDDGTEELFAGTDNVWDIRDRYQEAKKEPEIERRELLNRGRELHGPDYWLRGKDNKKYVNTIAPWDTDLLEAVDDHGNKVVYGQDNLPVIRYKDNGQVDNESSNLWPADNHLVSRLLHAYSINWLTRDRLKKYTEYNLSNQNNDQDYGNHDTCYIPKSLAGKKIKVKAVAVNVRWTDNYDAYQTFESHVFQLGELEYGKDLGGSAKVTYGAKGNYASDKNNAVISTFDVTGLNEGEQLYSITYKAEAGDSVFTVNDLEVQKVQRGNKVIFLVPTVKFPEDFAHTSAPGGASGLSIGYYLGLSTLRNGLQVGEYRITPYVETTSGRLEQLGSVTVQYDVEANRAAAVSDSYTFDIEEIKSGKYTSGTIDLFQVYPTRHSIPMDFSSATTTKEDVASVSADGKLLFGGSAGEATLSFTDPSGNVSEIKVTVLDYVDDVEISNINPPTIGSASFPTDVTIPEGADYHVKEVFWTNAATGERISEGEAARNYKNYTINIVIEKNGQTLLWKNADSTKSFHPYTLNIMTADGQETSVSKSQLNASFEYVKNPVTGIYEPGDTCVYSYTYSYNEVIGAADTVIDKIYMAFPTKVEEGESTEEWLETFAAATNGDDKEFELKKGFTFTPFAEQTFAAYGYKVDQKDPTDTMRSFVRGTVDGPKLEIDLDPSGLNIGAAFAAQNDISVLVNGGTNANTSLDKMFSTQASVIVPGTLKVKEGKGIPALPKYRVLDFNLFVGAKIDLNDLLVTDGDLSLILDAGKLDEEMTKYYTYDRESNTLEAIAESPKAMLIPLYVTIDGDGDGNVDMRVNVNRKKKVYATREQANVQEPVDNGEEVRVNVRILGPDGASVAFEGALTAQREKMSDALATLDLPEVDGAFVTGVARTRGGDFTWNQTAYSGQIQAEVTDGDSLTVYTTDASMVKVKTSSTEIYPDFPGVDNLAVSLDGDHWTASKIALTGLAPDTEYLLYYRQGLGDTFYTKVVRTDPAGSSMGVYVGRNPVTQYDLGNLEQDHYHYDPATRTLTLKNFNFSDIGIDVEDVNLLNYRMRAQSVIYADGDLTIHLLGDNFLEKTSAESSFLRGNVIRAKGDITFTGNGNLTITAMGTDQAVEPGAGKNIYLKGSGKQTFEKVGIPYYVSDGGKVVYENGEIDKNRSYGLGFTNEKEEFVTTGALHDLKAYAGFDDRAELEEVWISNAVQNELLIAYQEEFGPAKGIEERLNRFNSVHLVPKHTYDKDVASESYYVSGDCGVGTTYHKSCACGAADPENTFTAAAGNHELVHHEGKAATCYEDGFAAYDTCTKCDYTTFASIHSEGHTFVYHEEVKPTCETDGCPAYGVCSVCGFSTLDPKIAANLMPNGLAGAAEEAKRDDLWVANGHDIHKVMATAATCTANGTHEHYACNVCGKIFADEYGLQTVDADTLTIAAGHKLTYVAAVAATEENAGNKAYFICGDCGSWFEDADGKNLISDHNSVIIPPISKVEPTISKTSVVMKVGGSVTLTVADGTVTGWSSDNTAVATVSGGKVKGVKYGKATITAKLEGGKTLTCKVTVVKITKTSATLAAGSTLTLKVGGSAVKSWTTSNKAVATVSGGTVKGLKAGTATISAKLSVGGRLTCKVTVTAKLSKTSASLKAGGTLTLTVTGASVKSWASSAKAVAVVSKAGKVTALKKGTAKITATLTDGKKLTCTVKVTTNPTLKIGKKAYASSTTYSVKKGKYLTVMVTGKAAAATNAYASSKKAVATVATTDKKATTIKIKGVKAGSATISIKVNGVVFKIKVKVVK